MGSQVFVVGAGASFASAHTPRGADLVWEYHMDAAYWKRLDDAVMADEQHQFSLYRDFLVLAEQKFGLRGIVAEFDRRGHGMFSSYKKITVDEMLRTLLDEGDRQSVSLIRSLIAEHISGANRSSNELYQQFAECILETEQDPVVISFNFDCLLVEATVRTDFRFDYCRSFDRESSRYVRRRRRSIPLLKLHGSLDWTVCPHCRHTALITPPDSDYYRDARCCQCKRAIEPLIAVPHESLPEGLQTTWERAEEALADCSHLTVIGYSFPGYDHRAIELFRDHLSPGARVHIVDSLPDNQYIESCRSQVIERAQTIFGDQRAIEVSLTGFEGYIDDNCRG